MSDRNLICTTCGTVGNTSTETPGSFFIELALWVLFCAPGLVYTIWRLATRKKVCVACSSPALVPTNSPAGVALLARGQQAYGPPAGGAWGHYGAPPGGQWGPPR